MQVAGGVAAPVMRGAHVPSPQADADGTSAGDRSTRCALLPLARAFARFHIRLPYLRCGAKVPTSPAEVMLGWWSRPALSLSLWLRHSRSLS